MIKVNKSKFTFVHFPDFVAFVQNNCQILCQRHNVNFPGVEFLGTAPMSERESKRHVMWLCPP